jgi:hypothetical protein
LVFFGKILGKPCDNLVKTLVRSRVNFGNTGKILGISFENLGKIKPKNWENLKRKSWEKLLITLRKACEQKIYEIS